MQGAERELKIALALLLNAADKIEERPRSAANQCARSNLRQATHSVKATLKNLRQEKEETCKKP